MQGKSLTAKAHKQQQTVTAFKQNQENCEWM